MNQLTDAVYFGVVLSLLAYELGVLIRKKWNFPLFNPLLIATVVIIFVLGVLEIDYDTYYEGAKYISYLLTPSTICLAIPLYEQFRHLKENWQAVVLGILSGVLTSAISILVLCWVFHLDHEMFATLFPKSITTAIGLGESEELGGIPTITAASIIVTGILGNVIAETVFRIFHIEEPIAKGVGCGTSAHAIGTAKAMEIGQLEGAMSSLSIAVAGILTVVLGPIFMMIYPF